MPRPRAAPDLVVVPLLYLTTASAAVSLTRYDGGVAFLWIATAILVARLSTTPRRRWRGLVIGCGAASFAATCLFGLGPLAALPLAAINMGEAVLGAWLLRRSRLPDTPFQSLDWLAWFVLAVGVVAPAASAVAGATAAHLATGTPWLGNAVHWYAGHALGALTFTPVATLFFRGDVASWAGDASRRMAAETVALLLLVLVTSVGVFAQAALPLLFLPMLPVILATFRIGRLGAAISVVILALVGGACTIAGAGPISLMHASPGSSIQFFQLYLAATVLTVLPVAADLARRGRLYRALRDSEARYRVLAETSTDIILNLDPDGCIRFVSPSIRQLGGYEPQALIGRNAAQLVAPEHIGVVREAHLRTLGAGGAPVSVEYLGLTATGEARWFETHARAIVGDDGEVDGIVSVVRDITARKALEARLAEDALTDPLTGLANRRQFMALLERGVADPGGGGCVALFDIDHFKAVNDRWGHDAGDRVLKTFAEVARRTVRGGDSVARIGGEEFAVLLPGSTADQAQLVCERLRQALAATMTVHDGQPIRVTVSGGVARLEPDAGATLRAADAALYRAKAGGRDRLAIAA